MTSKNEKTEEERRNMLGRKGKSNTIKTNNTIRGNKSEDTSERKKSKKISRENKTTQTKQENTD